MKKILLGIVIGVVLSFSVTAYADEVNQMLGKKIDGEFVFKINGKKANKNVVVIEGTSYLPVRAAADLFSYDIDFDEITKEVHMQSKKFKGLSDFEKAKKSMSLLTFKTTVDQLVNTNDKIEVLNYNGEIYVPLAPIFAKTASWNGTILTVTVNSKTITATGNSTESDNAFLANGSFYIKLSSLDLKATVQGDTLVIEKVAP